MFKDMIPNLFTFLNLSFGMLSIISTMSDINGVHNLKLAALFIICSALVDRYDGRIARKIGAESDIGKQLDSLADLVSFGAAPALLAWKIFLYKYSIIGCIITLLFPIAGAYRLAKYNVSNFNNVFTGIPITIAGACMAIINFINIFYTQYTLFAAIIMLILAYSMISKIKIKKV